jgi:hypothetical protein
MAHGVGADELVADRDLHGVADDRDLDLAAPELAPHSHRMTTRQQDLT